MGLAPSQRSNIAPFYVMEIGALAAEETARGSRVLLMNVGEPAGGAARKAREAAAASLLENPLGYTVSTGLWSLRKRIAEHYLDWYGHSVEAKRIHVTAGASGGFTLAFLAAFDPGDRVGVTEPGYPCYRNTLEALGMTPVGIPVGPETNYRLTPELIEKEGKLDGLVIASPSNPTGTVLHSDDLKAIAQHCTANNIRLITDEIYHGLTFDSPATTILEHDPDAVVINSFSKYFGMTGWRLGWITAPDDLLAAIDKFAQNLYICAPHVAQVAGLASFDAHDELQPRVDDFKRKREVVLQGLHTAGLTDIAPADGAFYAYVNAERITNDSMSLCKQWITELKVAVTPGVDFDPVRGHHYLRFSYAGPEDDIRTAMERIVDWVNAR